MVKILKYILVILLISAPAFALDVIPNAKGYGVDTYAGSGRSEVAWSTTIRYVTNLNSTGAGSLRQAITDHNGSGTPSVIMFEVSGTIDLAAGIDITGQYLTIAGQTAPSPGIELKGTSANNHILLEIYNSDVLIQHLRFRPGDDYCDTGSADNIDALSINGYNNAVTNVVIDHCSFAWSIDEVISIWGYEGQQVSDVTFRNCIFGPALNDSCHTSGVHGYGPIVGQPVTVTTGATNILFDKNLFNRTLDRAPLLRSRSALLTNNLIYGWDLSATRLHGQTAFTSYPQYLSVVGNSYIMESYTETYNYAYPIANDGIGVGADQLDSGSEIYVDDNICPGFSPCNTYRIGTTPYVEVDPISWPDGLAALLISSADVKASILLNVGARPLDRDTVDTDVITALDEETGTIINCVEKDVGNADCDEVGEYAYTTRPTLAENTNDPLISTLIPGSPNADAGDGWTNLEVFLFGYSAAIEPGFSIYGVSPTGEGIGIDTDLNWTNPASAITVDVYFEEVSGACDLQIGDRISTGTLIATKEQGAMTVDTSYCWRIDVVHAGGTETGTVYEFTTTGGPPPAGLSAISYHSLGMTGVYDDQGATVGE